MSPRPSAPGRRAFTPKLPKPVGLACDGCVLEHLGTGYVPATGPASKVLLVGEAPGYDEVLQGEPFRGAAGSMLSRILRLIGRTREEYRIDNACRCAPPDLSLVKFPAAIARCNYLDATLAEGFNVVVPMGAVATRRLLGFTPDRPGFSIEHFHGTVTRDPQDRFWIVPTFHPSYLQRGAVNLMGVSAFDHQRALDVAAQGWTPNRGQTWINPPLDWFRAWATTYVAATTQDPYAYPLAVDIETPEKGADEADLVGTIEDATYQITQVNVSCGPDEGITVPGDPAYLAVLKDVLARPAVKYLWYKGYDVPRLRANGMTLDDLWCCDLMWAFKALQSDLPSNLGFAAPFYSTYGAWKHLCKGPDAQPLLYAAVDALQTRRVGDGIVGDLVREGRWDVFARQMHRYHAVILQPATDLGTPIDRARLTAFRATLDQEAGRLLGVIADAVPPELCPLAPPAGLTRPPTAELYTKANPLTVKGTPKKDAPDPLKANLYRRAKVIEKLVLREVTRCRACGTLEVAKTHRCEVSRGTLWCDADGKIVEPLLEKVAATVTRWFWQEPFNPDSPSQLLAYARAKGHPVGKAKGTGEDSMDKETLAKLIRETGDAVYASTLAYRAVAKVRGTYVVATENRLDDADRIHGTFGFKPSTMRLSSVNPNLQNVVADKGGATSLAAGFRKTIVARGQLVEAGSPYADLASTPR